MNYAYGDPNALSAGIGVTDVYLRARRFSVGDVFVERLLVHFGPPQSSFPSWEMFKSVVGLAPAVITQDLANFNLVGVNILPLEPTDAIVNWRGYPTAAAGPDGYLVDLVYVPTADETSWINTSAHASVATEAFTDSAFKSMNTPPMVEFVALRTMDDAAAKLAWQSVGALSVTSEGKTASGPALESGYKAQPKTWGRQLAVGLADFPNKLRPLVVGDVVGNTGGGTAKIPLFTWPGGGAAKAPSTDNLLVWGVFAVGGLILAREVWKAFR